ncbi:MAG: hypothetical protein H0X34_16610 [Chthoniobacterales bacterium]|nr:hypothetical protein [Chthoniobacterales bacterium]
MHVVRQEQLPFEGMSHEFVGDDNGGVGISFFLVNADCRAAYAELTARGVPCPPSPQQPSWGGWRVFARDPDGYLN